MRSQNRRRRSLALLALGAPASGLSTGFVRPFCVGVAGGTASGKSSVVSEAVSYTHLTLPTILLV